MLSWSAINAPKQGFVAAKDVKLTQAAVPCEGGGSLAMGGRATPVGGFIMGGAGGFAMGFEIGAEGGLARGLVVPGKGGGGGGLAPGTVGGLATGKAGGFTPGTTGGKTPGTNGGLATDAVDGRMMDESTEDCGCTGGACFGACTFWIISQSLSPRSKGCARKAASKLSFVAGGSLMS